METELSVVLPAYNEEGVLAASLEDLAKTLNGITPAWEIVCVNDGSVDGTGSILDTAAAADARIKPVHLSRNFGKEAAVCAGLDIANGKVVVLLDADRQHPPELIPEMIQGWIRGSDIVEARKRHRGKESWIYRRFAGFYYSIFLRATGVDLRNSADFQLLDRQVVDVLRRMPERSRFFRGLSNWLGFRRSYVYFDVRERSGGKTGWSIWSLTRYAAGSILSFSSAPLHMATVAGVLAVFLAITLAIQTLVRYFRGTSVDGFTTVIVANAFFSGVLLVSFGIMSTYVARVLEEVKARPTYVVRREAGTRILGTTQSNAIHDDRSSE